MAKNMLHNKRVSAKETTIKYAWETHMREEKKNYKII